MKLDLLQALDQLKKTARRVVKLYREDQLTKSAKEVREMMEEREKERGTRSKDTWVPKIKIGTHVMRIGPPWKKDADFWKDRLIHGIYKHKVYCAQNDIDKDTGKPRKCKVCRRYAKLRSDRSDFAQAFRKLTYQKREGLWNVVFAIFKEDDGKLIIRGIKDPKKFQVFQLSQKWSDLLCEFFTEEDYREESKLGITDLKKGRWIRLIRKGEKLDTEYRFRVFKEASKISDSSSERHELAKSLVDLDRLVKGSSDEELESFIEDMEKRAKKKGSSSSGSASSGSKSASASKSSSGSSSSENTKSKSKSSGSSGEDAEKVLKEMKKNLKDKKGKSKKGSSSSGDKKESKKGSSSSSGSKSASKSKSKSASKSSSGSKSSSKSSSSSAE